MEKAHTKKVYPRKERVQLLIDIEAYRSLRKGMKEAGINTKWFGQQVSMLVYALDQVVKEIKANQERGHDLTEKEGLAIIKEVAEKNFGMKIKDLLEKHGE